MTMTQERPAVALDSFAQRIATQQRERETALLRLARLRKAARDEIERLIEILDASDEYACDEREPDLASLDGPHAINSQALPRGDDREAEDEYLEDDDPAEDDGLSEPSLAAPERHASNYMFAGRNNTGDQTHWSDGNRRDLEDEHDGTEPDDDGEPSLGWTDNETIFSEYAGRSFGIDFEGPEAA